MKSEKYICLGRGTALISFLVGTLILDVYFFTSTSEVLFIGYRYIAIAGIANLIILLAILVKSNSDSANRTRLVKAGGLMLINVPIMLLFIWFAIVLNGNMRITFTNSTQSKLTHIKIVGCETKHVPDLEPNESKTVWVGITGDCSISLEYLENGTQKKETVAGYVTTGMGQRMKHKIDGRNKDIL
ncbi:MAG: hypothetical protein ACOH13_09845 [Flavobacteriales bacterium]